MFRNAAARRDARINRRMNAAPIVLDDESVTLRRRPSRSAATRAAVVVSQYGYDW
ncbi:hypothetical protein AB0B94_31015 [Micromonospora sp. NPDC048986]|uniref:hypothetical protein n=1 Tax=Micromonospora sp. NPDC048986 TaxID=3155644 RepID=UPI0033D82934